MILISKHFNKILFVRWRTLLSKPTSSGNTFVGVEAIKIVSDDFESICFGRDGTLLSESKIRDRLEDKLTDFFHPNKKFDGKDFCKMSLKYIYARIKH